MVLWKHFSLMLMIYVHIIRSNIIDVFGCHYVHKALV